MTEPQTQPETTGAISESEAAERLSAIFAGSDNTEDPEVEPPSPEEPEVEEIEESEGEEISEEPEDEEFEDDEEIEESDEDGENEDDYEEGDGEDLHTVKVRGEELKVPYEELIRGYSRNEDYTRSKQELAKREQEVLGEYRGARDTYAQELDMVGQLLQSMAPEAQNWEQLRTQDPQRFAEEYGNYQAFQQRMGAIRQRMAAVQQEAQREQEYHRAQRLQREQERLLELIPEWQDEEVASKEYRELTEFVGHEYGFDPEDITAIEDARVFRVLKDAMAYRDLKRREQSVKQKGRKARKKLAPGSKPPQGKRVRKTKATRNALNRLKETGSEADAAAALKAIGI